MPQTSNRFYDQMARLWSDAAGVAQGVRREAGSLFRTQAERFIADMDLVKREDFDAVREMASNARAENDRLSAKIAELEGRLAAMGGVVALPAVPALAPIPRSRRAAATTEALPPADGDKPKRAGPRGKIASDPAGGSEG